MDSCTFAYKKNDERGIKFVLLWQRSAEDDWCQIDESDDYRISFCEKANWRNAFLWISFEIDRSDRTDETFSKNDRYFSKWSRGSMYRKRDSEVQAKRWDRPWVVNEKWF